MVSERLSSSLWCLQKHLASCVSHVYLFIGNISLHSCRMASEIRVKKWKIVWFIVLLGKLEYNSASISLKKKFCRHNILLHTTAPVIMSQWIFSGNEKIWCTSQKKIRSDTTYCKFRPSALNFELLLLNEFVSIFLVNLANSLRLDSWFS